MQFYGRVMASITTFANGFMLALRDANCAVALGLWCAAYLVSLPATGLCCCGAEWTGLMDWRVVFWSVSLRCKGAVWSREVGFGWLWQGLLSRGMFGVAAGQGVLGLYACFSCRGDVLDFVIPI